MPDEPSDLITIRMSADQWSDMDASLDNEAALAAWSGTDDAETRAVVAFADRARHDGARQVPWVNGQWPPMDTVLDICLTREQWTFIRQSFVESRESYVSLGDTEAVAGCDEDVAIIDRHL